MQKLRAPEICFEFHWSKRKRTRQLSYPIYYIIIDSIDCTLCRHDATMILYTLNWLYVNSYSFYIYIQLTLLNNKKWNETTSHYVFWLFGGCLYIKYIWIHYIHTLECSHLWWYAARIYREWAITRRTEKMTANEKKKKGMQKVDARARAFIYADLRAPGPFTIKQCNRVTGKKERRVRSVVCGLSCSLLLRIPPPSFSLSLLCLPVSPTICPAHYRL